MSLHPRVLKLHQFVDPNELSRSRAIPTPNDAENGTKRPDHDFPLSPASLHRKIRWGGFGEGGPSRDLCLRKHSTFQSQLRHRRKPKIKRDHFFRHSSARALAHVSNSGNRFRGLGIPDHHEVPEPGLWRPLALALTGGGCKITNFGTAKIVHLYTKSANRLYQL